MKYFLRLLFLSIFFVIPAVSAAPVPDTDTIPPSLEPWKPWVLHGEEERFCPTSYNDGEDYQCVWPSVLDLEVEGNGGIFTQKWRVFVEGWVRLPGGVCPEAGAAPRRPMMTRAATEAHTPRDVEDGRTSRALTVPPPPGGDRRTHSRFHRHRAPSPRKGSLRPRVR